MIVRVRWGDRRLHVHVDEVEGCIGYVCGGAEGQLVCGGTVQNYHVL